MNVRKFKPKKIILIIVIFSLISFIFIKKIQKKKGLKPHTREYSTKDLELLQNQINKDIEILRLQKLNTETNEKIIDQKLKKIEPELRTINTKNRKYLILEYTKVFKEPKFCYKSAEEIFNSNLEKCEFSNCYYTCDTKKATVDNSDALIFHQRDLEMEFQVDYKNDFQKWYENTNQLPYKSIPEKNHKNSNQVWVLWNDESTPVNPDFNKISNLFNWTLTYKTDAEVYEGSYGFFQQKKLKDLNEITMLKDIIYFDHFKTRKNAVLWFVSNCKSLTRINVALQLSKYFPVHVYGKCDILNGMDGQKASTIYPYLFRNQLNDCPRDSKCEKNLLNSFKYYLAFENRNCTDYITEKLWRTLSNKLIPIVLQPTRDSYDHYSIPTESIIHLQDFDYKPEELSIYLKSMNNDFEAYYNKMKWTNVYMNTLDKQENVEPHRMCQLCKRLNTFPFKIYYKDIGQFFNGKCYD